MKPRLVAISGPLEGQTFEIDADCFVMGRRADCNLRFSDIEISRRHCVIEGDESRGFTLRDLGSRHGILVNGRRSDETALMHSDLVTLGANALLFLLDDTAPTVRGLESTGSGRVLGASLERRVTDSFHLDPARVDAALPAQARLARELHSLLRLSTALQEHRKIGPLAGCLLDIALEAVPVADGGAVLLREPGLEQPVILAQRGDGAGPISGEVESLLQGNVAACGPFPRAAHDSPGGPGEASFFLAAPLNEAGGEPFGLLFLCRRNRDFAAHHLELSAAIAGVAAPAFQNVLHLRWLERENHRLRDQDAVRHKLIGDSAAIRTVLDLVARVARADSTVLIAGESGTGKELVAHAVHNSSPRADGPFVAVNCATLTEGLLESELFGHEKGSFTGALARKVGKMEAAHRGTLFLDEVAEIPVGLQAKLLRALQERNIERVGGTRPIPIDVRIVAATHRDLARAVKEGDFREDLFFRLQVIVCRLPPLRERREDIPLLVRHFARLHGEKLGFTGVGITPESRRCLMSYDWPGNVRELGNVIERAVVLGDGEVIRREDLPDEVAATGAEDTFEVNEPSSTRNFQATLISFKKQLILEAWKAAGEDYVKTAERLGIHVNSLHRMVKNLGIRAALGR